jgi:hypothetical protein
MGTDVLPALSRLWVAHLDASLAIWRVTDRLWSSSLDACFSVHDHGMEDRERFLLDEVPGSARGQRFRQAEEAVRELALGLRVGKVQHLEAMIEAIDCVKQRRSSCRRALEASSSSWRTADRR